jgi:hypothetical protein
MRFFSKKKKHEAEKTKPRPIDKLFHDFILDTIKISRNKKKERLKKNYLENMYSNEFDAEEVSKEILQEVLHLSDTIEIAIKDLWLTNSEIAKRDGIELSPEKFAIKFKENFLTPGSKIDIWENESDLIRAKERIAESYLAE